MKKIIIANWKMNPSTLKEAKLLFNSMKKEMKKNIKNVEVVICPPFVYLPVLGSSLFAKDFGELRFGSQDCFWEERGAFTGEISPKMLKDLDCEYVIIGHSERRKYLGETDEMINKKLKAVISAELKPILCIGETKQQRKTDKTFEVLKNQLKKNLKGVKNYFEKMSKHSSRCLRQKLKIENLIIAYEPIWAIGTGKACSVEKTIERIKIIRKTISELFGKKQGERIKVLYGGSINSKIVKDYLEEKQIDGLLVGGGSVEINEFLKIIHFELQNTFI